MKIRNVLMAVSFFLVAVFSGQAMATPIYEGSVSGDPTTGFAEGSLPDATYLTSGPGYYIWANDDARTSWSVRWTGADWSQGFTVDEQGRQIANVSSVYNWSGVITYTNNDGLNDPVSIAWEDGATPTLTDASIDLITFGEATAGPHWDGFDFTLAGDIGDYLTFSLGSSFFTLNNDGVYLGADLLSVFDNAKDGDLTAFYGSNGETRQFEVAAPVPEPGTLLLLGSGLAGLAAARRRKKA